MNGGSILNVIALYAVNVVMPSNFVILEIDQRSILILMYYHI